MLSSPTYVAGDFNIRLDRADDPHAAHLRSVFDAFGLTVSNSGSTHQSGSTIDAVASRPPTSVSTLDVDDFIDTDHRLLCWSVASSPPSVPTFSVVRRPWHHLDMDLFRPKLLSSALCQPQLWPSNVNDAAKLYDDVIVDLLDCILPARPVVRRPRPSDPWFDADCRLAKRYTRRLERAAASARRRSEADTSGSSAAAADAARAEWLAQRRAYRHLRHRKCASFWTDEFTAAATNPRQIWSTVDRLLGRGRRSGDSIRAVGLLPHQSGSCSSVDFRLVAADIYSGCGGSLPVDFPPCHVG